MPLRVGADPDEGPDSVAADRDGAAAAVEADRDRPAAGRAAVGEIGVIDLAARLDGSQVLSGPAPEEPAPSQPAPFHLQISVSSSAPSPFPSTTAKP
jgi:hypothetical protein